MVADRMAGRGIRTNQVLAIHSSCRRRPGVLALLAVLLLSCATPAVAAVRDYYFERVGGPHGLAQNTGNFNGAFRGKQVAVAGAVGAILAGLAPTAINMLFKAAGA